jgi:RimJ/RimL family protein N-acetyltransferase
VAIPNEIETERLLLRPPRETDADQLFSRYGQDLAVCRYMSWVPQRSVDDTLAFLRTAEDAGRINWMIFLRATGELLGSVGGLPDGYRMQFGYCLARDAWGHGYATEAARAFVAAALNEPAIWRVQAFCDVENRASARVLEKCGLSLEGRLRRYLVMPNLGDQPRDMLLYAKVRENGPARNG